ncbi:MAG: GNAT family N-acetyltransferase [Acidimicrobiales bacterium]
MPSALLWPQEPSPELAEGVHRIIHAVVSLGGAVGWLAPPGRDETDRWLAGVTSEVASGDGALCVATLDSVPQAIGAWRRGPRPVFANMAKITKIMAHPEARGRSLGREVTAALIDDAREAAIETLSLGVRGNNHLAIALYESLGFEVYGRLPNVLGVGDDRFDEVRMYLQFPRPGHVRWHGSGPGGPGGSPGPVSSGGVARSCPH